MRRIVRGNRSQQAQQAQQGQQARQVQQALLVLLAASFGCSPCGKSASLHHAGTPGRTGTASISGNVSFQGRAPELTQLSRGAFSECASGQQRRSAIVLSPEGKVAEVVVYVREGLQPGDYPVPAAQVTLEQRGCDYLPRVFALRAGQGLIVSNGDPALHNVHALGLGPNAFNFAMPQGRAPVEMRFTEQQIPVTISCDVHPWMRSFAAVLEHPFFAVTGSDGAFALQGLPPGTYALEAWHERLGRFTQTVAVREGEAARVDFLLR